MDLFVILKDKLKQLAPEMDVRVCEPLSKHTSFRIGGPAALLAMPSSAEQARLAVKTAVELGIEPFFIGNGSNLLVADEGINRFVIKTSNLRAVQVDDATLEAESGVTLARLAMVAAEQGLTGLEFAHGIPGTLGGAVMMNAGAYGGEMAQVVTEVTCLSLEGTIEKVYDFGFGYRRSVFNDGKRLILGVRLELRHAEAKLISARMEELAEARKSKQPLDFPSAGSMFKRPEGHYAAALIDRCGLKGFRVGGAQVSEKHAGFVINRGGATCSDVLALVDQVKCRVREQTGIELEMEVKVLR